MNLESHQIESLFTFLAQAGRTGENAEAWVHAFVDLQTSFQKIYGELLPEAISSATQQSEKGSREILWDIREEMRHIEYHLQDIAER